MEILHIRKGMKLCSMMIIFLVFIFSVQAAIIFEDNFDSQANWQATFPIGGYPNPDDSAGAAAYCNPGANGIGTTCNFASGGFSLPSPYNVVRVQGKTCAAREFQGLYFNSIPGYPYESAGACYGGNGKCLTVWEELCGDNFDHSDNDIGIALPDEYQEAWIRFRFKVGRRANGLPYYANHELTGGTMKKLWHFQHWDSETGASPFNYFSRDQHNYPVTVGGYSMYENYFELYDQSRCWCSENDYPDNDNSVNCADGTARTAYGCCSTCTGYPYYGDPSDIWDNYGSWTPLTSRIGDGNWHTIEIHLKVNDYNSTTNHWNSNGQMVVYYDGVAGTGQGHWTIVPQLQDGADPVSPRGYKMFAIGGNSNNYDPSCSGTGCWQYYVYDDFVISTSYIGLDYVINSTQETYHVADTNHDNRISTTELLLYVQSWKSDTVALNDLIDAIKLWKTTG
jgi:hypothetical protein